MSIAAIDTEPAADLPTLVAELRATRARAVSALAELRQAQRDSEARMAQRPGSAGGDTYRRVAGTTSLERAAVAAERVIAAADRQLASLSGAGEVKGVRSWSRAR
jgi:hypothetical protein